MAEQSSCPILTTFVNVWTSRAGKCENLLVQRVPQIEAAPTSEVLQARRVAWTLYWLTRKVAPDWIEITGDKELADTIRSLRADPLSLSTLDRINRILVQELKKPGHYRDYSTPLKETARELVADMGITAALAAVVQFKRPSLSVVAFHAATVSLNRIIACMATGPAAGGVSKPESSWGSFTGADFSDPEGKMASLEAATRQSAVELLDRMVSIT